MSSARANVQVSAGPAPARLAKPRRISEHNWPQDATPVVSIICATYNHEQFIEQCIEGFLMQETNFPVEIIVHDDASEDRTADIIRAYHTKHPGVFYPILQTENQWQTGKCISIPLCSGARGEYISFCEGDDYWTNPQKLQMQVEFLDSRAEMALCHTLTEQVLTENGTTTIIDTLPLPEFRREACATDLIACNFILTASTMFRRDWMPRIDARHLALKVGDWPLWYLLAERGAIGFLNSSTAVYRIHDHNSFAGQAWQIQCERVAGALLFMASRATQGRSSHILRKAEYFAIDAASGQTGFAKAAEVLWNLCRQNHFTHLPWLRFLALIPFVHLRILRRKLRLISRLKALFPSRD